MKKPARGKENSWGMEKNPENWTIPRDEGTTIV